MSIFPNRSKLSDPTNVDVIPPEDFTYVVTRAQLDAFNAVHRELKFSNIQRNELAKRLGMNEGQLSRLLAAPGNWGLGTAAKIFWAIGGGRIKFDLDYPMKKSRRNDTQPWREPDLSVSKANTSKTLTWKLDRVGH